MIRQGPKDAQTIPVHVQIVDLEPKTLDIILPDYLPAADLTQRVARDAKLGAFWPDGQRRIFYLRARGRLMQPTERLKDLGIVPYELLHLLPEPPEGSGVQERPPEYPANRGYAGAGWVNTVIGFVVLFLWTVCWSIALTLELSDLPEGGSQSFLTQARLVMTGVLPALGLAMICTSFARHVWGGLGSQVKIPLTAVVLFVSFLVMAAVLPATGAMLTDMGLIFIPALITGLLSVMIGWLAWYGAVEPLPKITRKEVADASANVTFPCGICGGEVTQDVKADCVYGCGRVFHAGCYEAKRALSAADGCTVCGYKPA